MTTLATKAHQSRYGHFCFVLSHCFLLHAVMRSYAFRGVKYSLPHALNICLTTCDVWTSFRLSVPLSRLALFGRLRDTVCSLVPYLHIVHSTTGAHEPLTKVNLHRFTFGRLHTRRSHRTTSAVLSTPLRAPFPGLQS